jgi:hypothetical protein
MLSKVFVIGLSRTGTTSVHHALIRLGYRSAHWTHSSGRLLELTDLYDLDAAGDIGISFAFETLARAFPSALFIYTTREREAWVGSITRHYDAASPAIVAERWAGRKLEDRNRSTGIENTLLWRLIHDSLYLNHQTWGEAYEAHELAVASFFGQSEKQSARLLTLDVTTSEDQWLKLGAFLRMSPPPEPFPNVTWQSAAQR